MEVTEFQFPIKQKKVTDKKVTAHCHFGSGCTHRPPPIAVSAVALGHSQNGDGWWPTEAIWMANAKTAMGSGLHYHHGGGCFCLNNWYFFTLLTCKLYDFNMLLHLNCF